MPTPAEVAAQLLAVPVPVLFLDTCSLLDVVRAPDVERGLSGCFEAATELLRLSTATPPQCNLAIGSFVPIEWATNAPKVLSELQQHLQGLEEQAIRFHDLSSHLGITLPFEKPAYQQSMLAKRLHTLSEQLLRTAYPVDRYAATSQRAYERVAVTGRRPCRKGAELKDCTIFEEYLEVCRHLQAMGFACRQVFCTSNTRDYCDPGVTPHAEIAADCAAVGLQFTTSMPWALAEIQRSP